MFVPPLMVIESDVVPGQPIGTHGWRRVQVPAKVHGHLAFSGSTLGDSVYDLGKRAFADVMLLHVLSDGHMTPAPFSLAAGPTDVPAAKRKTGPVLFGVARPRPVSGTRPSKRKTVFRLKLGDSANALLDPSAKKQRFGQEQSEDNDL